MKQICVFGNSHLAALREASTKFEGRWPNATFTMVGGHEDKLLQTEITDGILRPTDPDTADAMQRLGGVSEVALNRFDAVLIAGCQIALSRAGFMYKHMRWPGLPSQQGATYDTESPYQLVSEACFAAQLGAALSGSLGGQLAQRLRAGTSRPIYLSSQPRTNTGVKAVKKHALSILNDVVADGDARALSQMFDRTATQLFDSLGVTFLAQPRNTITEDVLTLPAYTNGALRLTFKGRFKQPPTDLIHANATYGALVLDQIVEAVGAA